MSISEILRIIIGSIFFLFVPGYFVTWAIFPSREELDAVERITLSLAFSISVVPLIVLFLNQTLGVETFPIDVIHSVLASILVIIFSLFVWYLRYLRTRRKIKK